MKGTRQRCAGEPRLAGLATLACVEASRIDAGRTTRSSSYYLSSARLTPETFARAVRGHRAIENSPHRVLDVTFDEARQKMSLARKRKRAGWSDAFARTVIGQMRFP